MSTAPAGEAERPLCVDLDGSLVRCDTTWDMLSQSMVRTPWDAIRILRHLRAGREHLKEYLWSRAPLDAAYLPYNESVQNLVREGGASRSVLLVSGSVQALVDDVIELHGVFSGGFGSTEGRNLTGGKKARLLVDLFGVGGFDYVGNDHDDLPVWRVAHSGVAVDASASLARQVRREGLPVEFLSTSSSRNDAWISALRVRQWIKNLLCVVPILASHSWNISSLWLGALQIFAALCIGSSLIYIGNDLHDLDSDRKHASKRRRAFACGALQTSQAWSAVAALFLIWATLVFSIGGAAALLLILQAVASLVYTLLLKRMPVLDVLWLGVLYGNRIVIGGIALGIALSSWLIAFALFLFLGLACMKRYGEVSSYPGVSYDVIPGRGYVAADHELLRLMGYGSSLMSVVVLSLYIVQPEVSRLYPSATYLWLLCLLLFYWQTRLWMHVLRGDCGDDPLEFVITDGASYLCLLLGLSIVVVAARPIG